MNEVSEESVMPVENVEDNASCEIEHREKPKRRRSRRFAGEKKQAAQTLVDPAEDLLQQNQDGNLKDRLPVEAVSLLPSVRPEDALSNRESLTVIAEELVSGAPLIPSSPSKRSRSRARGRKKAREEVDAQVEQMLNHAEANPTTGLSKPPKTQSQPVKKMLVSVLPGDLVEVALMEDGQMREYYVEMTHQAKIRGNIYKGVISNIDVNLQAAFVNYGGVKNGFLQIDEVHPEYYLQPHDASKGHRFPPIQKVLRVGQEVLVQVVKEPAGSKGAFLTTKVSLAGRFLVLTPGQEQIGISRKVEDAEERSRLRELIVGLNPGDGLGAIVRTVSAGTGKTTLQKDLSYLKRVWKDIRKRAGTEKAPCLIYQEPGLASRCIRDYLSEDIAEIWVDDAQTAENIRVTTSMLFPRRGDLVRLYENRQETLWEKFSLLHQIEQVFSREVILPSGGRLVFDQTEALMAVDINSGRTTGKTNFETMAFRTNMEAAVAIANQLRLRDVGGQIVIDFIEMRDPDRCRDVEKAMRAAMKSDRARHDIGKMSSFGLLEIVRQRIAASAISISMEPCPHCNGTGQRRNREWQAVQTIRDLYRKMRSAVQEGLETCICRMDAEHALYLLNTKRDRLAELEHQFGIRLEIRISGSIGVETDNTEQSLGESCRSRREEAGRNRR
ncbi:MAG: Rne/Rng family ribonuclease [Desulfovibrionaceae bacterium]|nr:Rne/Rng family ribonuclease [Desulfovibrionaceae bacterium]